MKATARGFTLVEVLVALAIVAVALGAGIQAAGALSDNAERLADVSAAQWCADNELTNLKLSKQFPGVGDSDFACQQFGRNYAGQIAVRSGLRRKRVLLSAATTPAAILAAIENSNGSAPRATLQPILEALQIFSTAVYGRAGEADAVALSTAVDNAVDPVRRLWLRSLVPFGAARGTAVPMPSRAGSAA